MTIGPDDDRDKALREYMDKAQFWPNVWTISDHGNPIQIIPWPEKQA